jgi:hypothetical protein
MQNKLIKNSVKIVLCIFLLMVLVLGVQAGVPPVASFTGSPTSGTAPLTVQFTDVSTGSPIGWAWFFGDETYTAPWTQMTANAGWSPRYKPSSVAMPDGSIVLMGGLTGTDKNDVWRSTDNGVTWTQLTSSAGWSVRDSHTSVVMPDGSIVLMGGGNGITLFNDVWRSTDNGATWTQMTASAGWSARWFHSSVAMPDGSIVLMGGFSGSSHKNDVWLSTDKGVTWTQQTASAGWPPRVSHSSVAMPDGSIVLMGGDDGSSNYKNDVWRSTDNGVTWIQMTANAGWSPRVSHSSVAMPDGSIVLMGGWERSWNFQNDVWRSTDNGVTWTQMTANAGWSARDGHSSMAMPDGSIVLLGGGSGGLKNDVWRLMVAGSSVKNPTHTYLTAGTYTVALTATNSAGSNPLTRTNYITVTKDVTLPSITITSPTSGQKFTTATVTVKGTASDNVGLSKVEVKVGAGAWQRATGTTSWSKSVTLARGLNRITARATDTSGNYKDASVIVAYIT